MPSERCCVSISRPRPGLRLERRRAVPVVRLAVLRDLARRRPPRLGVFQVGRDRAESLEDRGGGLDGLFVTACPDVLSEMVLNDRSFGEEFGPLRRQLLRIAERFERCLLLPSHDAQLGEVALERSGDPVE